MQAEPSDQSVAPQTPATRSDSTRSFGFLILLCALTLIAFLTLVGCEAENAVKRGDSAMGVGANEEAYRQYQIARHHKPQLTHDPGFVTKYNHAKSRAAYDLARRRATAGDWESALSNYAEAINVDPGFTLARNALAEASEKAAVAFHQRAQAQADVDRLAEADRLLRRALDLAPSATQARAALVSIDNPPVTAAWTTAMRHRDARRWPEAVGAFTEIIGVNPNHLPARAEKHRANLALSRSRQLASRGKTELDRQQLDSAIASLNEALSVWPFNSAAETDLRAASTLKGQAVFRHDAAVGHAAAGRWDNAIVANEASLKLYPGYAPAKEYASKLRLDAANDMIRLGDEELLAADPDAALGHFLKALGYRPDHEPAKAGLARVSVWRGDRFVEQNQVGHALLWYMDAETHYAGSAYRQKIDDARARVLSTAVFGLGANVVDDRGNTTAHTLAMDQRLTHALTRSAPSFVYVGDRAGAAPRVYHSHLAITGVTIGSRVAKTESLSHEYTTYRDVINPRIDHLHYEIQHARGDLIALERRYNERCHVCGGGGRSACGACGGRGHTACPTHREPQHRSPQHRYPPPRPTHPTHPQTRPRPDQTRPPQTRPTQNRPTQNRPTQTRPTQTRSSSQPQPRSDMKIMGVVPQPIGASVPSRGKIYGPQPQSRPSTTTTRPSGSSGGGREGATRSSGSNRPAAGSIGSGSRSGSRPTSLPRSTSRPRSSPPPRYSSPSPKPSNTGGSKESKENFRGRGRGPGGTGRGQRVAMVLGARPVSIDDHELPIEISPETLRQVAQLCPTCGGSRNVRCSQCGGRGQRECSHCGGSGKRYRVSGGDLSRARSRLQHLEHELIIEPRLIREAVVSLWPYEVRHHVMEGVMSTTLSFGFDGSRSDQNKGASPQSFETRWVLEDAETLNANPAIGLPEDPLVLADHATVTGALLDDAAQQAARRLLSAAVGFRVGELKERAKAHAEAGRRVEALEAEVAAALVQESVNAEAGRAMLEALRPGG
ncbi:MAG: hypothetical protein ACYTGQ_04020 [Planctomycetota bacterium]|jgi:tetratricopeptide (TPR) repeat protein